MEGGDGTQFYTNGYADQIAAAGVKLVFLDPIQEYGPNGESRSRGYEDETIFRDIESRAADFDSLIIISNDADFTLLALRLILMHNKRIEIATAAQAFVSKYLVSMADAIHNIDSFIPALTAKTA